MQRTTTSQNDGLVLAATFLALAAALGSGGGPAVIAIAAASGFALATLVTGRRPGRSGGAGLVVLVLGSTLVQPVAGGLPWGDLVVLGLLTATAHVGGALARYPAPNEAEGWMTFVVTVAPTEVPASRRGRRERREVGSAEAGGVLV